MAAAGTHRIRIGLLGLGTVGQAVARTVSRTAGDGLDVTVGCALVRDITRARRVPPGLRLTTNPEAFLRGRYDVVIDALAGREPAATLVARVLGRGVPVVSANKSMLATDAPRLRRIAARAGTVLRVEAAAIAGVPFIGTLERRPLAARADRFTGVLNGTSNYVLTRMAAGVTLDGAVSEAQSRGYAEPDPHADLSGADARDKVAVLTPVLLGAALSPGAIDTSGITGLTPADLDAASRLGGAIRPIGHAAKSAHGIAAFAAPCWLPASHPLATLHGIDNGIAIEGRYVPRVWFAGPGAGATITAATLLDDALEAVSGGSMPLWGEATESAAPQAPAATGWFIRLPATREASRLEALIATSVSIDDTRWALVPASSAPALLNEVSALRDAGVQVPHWRALDV